MNPSSLVLHPVKLSDKSKPAGSKDFIIRTTTNFFFLRNIYVLPFLISIMGNIPDKMQ